MSPLQTNVVSNRQFIKSLKNMELLGMTEQKIISHTFNSYESITEQKNHFSINKVLKLCSSYPQISHKIFNLWTDDITHTNNATNVSHALLLKSCANVLKKQKQYLSTTDIEQCIEILQYILSQNQLREKSNVYSVLITAYAHHQRLDICMRLFNEIPKHKRGNIAIVSALMSAHFHNKDYDRVISLYKDYYSFNNEMTHLLALKACTFIGNINNGIILIFRARYASEQRYQQMS